MERAMEMEAAAVSAGRKAVAEPAVQIAKSPRRPMSERDSCCPNSLKKRRFSQEEIAVSPSAHCARYQGAYD